MNRSDDPAAAVCAAARFLDARGLNHGAAGNVGLRDGDRLLITPTGVAPADLVADDIPRVAADGTWSGRLKPSSEWGLHHAVLAARPELNAVIHTHAPFCSTLACHDRGLPRFHYMVAMFGGHDVPCAPYATFGTPELAENAATAMARGNACLLSHHGMLVAAPDLDKAQVMAVELEHLAEVYWRALQIGEPPLLPAGEMDRVLAKFATYGQQPDGTG